MDGSKSVQQSGLKCGDVLGIMVEKHEIHGSFVYDTATGKGEVKKPEKVMKKKAKGNGSFNAYGSEGPPRGDVPKTELVENIAEMLDMNDQWVEGLSKANRSSIIALRNCVLAKVE